VLPRWRIFDGLALFGVRLSPRRNASLVPVEFRDSEPTTVRVVRIDEDLMVVRPACTLRRIVTEEGL